MCSAPLPFVNQELTSVVRSIGTGRVFVREALTSRCDASNVASVLCPGRLCTSWKRAFAIFSFAAASALPQIQEQVRGAAYQGPGLENAARDTLVVLPQCQHPAPSEPQAGIALPRQSPRGRASTSRQDLSLESVHQGCRKTYVEYPR